MEKIKLLNELKALQEADKKRDEDIKEKEKDWHRTWYNSITSRDQYNAKKAALEDAVQYALVQKGITLAKKEEWEVAVLAHYTQQLNKNIANYIIERKARCCSVTCKGCESCECIFHDDMCLNKDTCLGGCWVCKQCCEPCCDNIACNDPERLYTHPWKPCEHCNEYCCGICEDCGLCCRGVCCEKCPCCGDRHRHYNDFVL